MLPVCWAYRHSWTLIERYTPKPTFFFDVTVHAWPHRHSSRVLDLER